MKSLKYIAILAVLLCWGSPCLGGSQKETLHGIKNIEVVVQKMKSYEAKKLGLTENVLQTEVELKLKTVGINVLSEEESFDIPGSPWLNVNVTLIKNPSGGLFFNIVIMLHQDAILRNNPEKSFDAVTWHNESMGYAPDNTLAEQIRDALKGQVDRFTNDFLSVNPIQKKKK